MTAPASLNFVATVDSRETAAPSSANEPASSISFCRECEMKFYLYCSCDQGSQCYPLHVSTSVSNEMESCNLDEYGDTMQRSASISTWVVRMS